MRIKDVQVYRMISDTLRLFGREAGKEKSKEKKSYNYMAAANIMAEAAPAAAPESELALLPE